MYAAVVTLEAAVHTSYFWWTWLLLVCLYLITFSTMKYVLNNDQLYFLSDFLLYMSRYKETFAYVVDTQLVMSVFILCFFCSRHVGQAYY